MKKLTSFLIMAAFAAVSASAQWALTGNSGTTTSNFLGTTDNAPLIFKVNNVRVGFIGTSSNPNISFGHYSLPNALTATGSDNTSIGTSALSNNTSGSYNVANGTATLYYNKSGSYNVVNGYLALFYNNGDYNVANGANALHYHTTGNNNIGIGNMAGMYASSIGQTVNLTNNNSIFLGSNTRAQANGQTNQIVIGYGAIGNGSNTVTIGNDEIEKTILKGDVGVGTTTPTPNYKLDVNGNTRMFGDIWGKDVLSFQDNARFNVSKNNVPTLNPSSVSMPHYGLAVPSAGGSAELWLAGANGIRMFTNGNPNPRISISSDGKIGIGTTNIPVSHLEVADATGGVLSITTKQLNGTTLAPLLPSIEFLGYQNGKKVRLSATEQTATTHGSKFSIQINDGSNANSLVERFVILSNGNIGIGITPGANTTDPKLDVNGVIRAHELRACVNMGCDYVFEDNYKLMNLNDLNNFIKINKHLPEVAPATQMEAEGINVSEMNILLLKKVEELTLYIIQLQETVDKQNLKIENLENKNK